jgi:transcription antitermination factor NusA-like protein
VLRKIVRNNIVELLKALFELEISEINDAIEVQIKSCNEKYKEVFGH